MAYGYFAETDRNETVFAGLNLNYLIKNGHQAAEDNWISQIRQIDFEVFSSASAATFEVDEFAKLIPNAQRTSNAWWGLPTQPHTTPVVQRPALQAAQIRNPHVRYLNGRTSVYELLDDDGDLLYCGISTNPFRRWTQHLRTKSWAENVCTIAIEWCDSREIALTLEHDTIKKHGPPFNLNRGEYVSEPLPEHLLPETRQLTRSLSALLWNCASRKEPLPFGINARASLGDIIAELKVRFGSLLAAGRAVWDAVNQQVGRRDPYPIGQDHHLRIAA
jgi:predicted GIY-YIG superfamily endonuclease